MNILIVNDDGYDAKGIEILARVASHFGNIYISSPAFEQSAKSHAITYKSPMHIEEIEPLYGSLRSIKVHGTPADCVRAGIKIFDVDFDLVLSGINDGVNIATDLLYSGTVAAALEASIFHVPSIAFSAHRIHLSYLYDETYKVLDEIFDSKLHQKGAVLNVNFPHESHQKIKGVRMTKQGHRIQHLEYVKTDKPHIYNLVPSEFSFKEDEDSDMHAYLEGYISITPLTTDRTNYQALKPLLKQSK